MYKTQDYRFVQPRSDEKIDLQNIIKEIHEEILAREAKEIKGHFDKKKGNCQ